MSKYNLYLGDILRTIKLIEDSGIGKKVSYLQFLGDRNLFDATNMRLQIIGESLFKLSKKMLSEINGVDVKRFLQTRNIVSHAYFAIKESIIWSMALDDVQKLKKGVQELLKKEEKKVKQK